MYVMTNIFEKVFSRLIMVKEHTSSMFTKNKETINLDMLKGGWTLWSEIVNIEEIGEMDMIDIEVSGNHLFYANGILTHNSNSDVGLEDTSESFGLPATVDFMFALISTEELEQINQIMIKQLKNRYSDPNHYRRFVVGVDRDKMRLYDVEQDAQDDILDGPNNKDNQPIISNMKKKIDNSKFEGFK